MTSIEKINIGNCLSRQNIKNILGYAVKNRKVYYSQLRRIDNRNGETVEQFKSVGFINADNILKPEKYSITDSGDKYYKDVFGKYSYLGKRLSGIWERFKKKHL